MISVVCYYLFHNFGGVRHLFSINIGFTISRDRTEQNRAEQNRTVQNRTEPTCVALFLRVAAAAVPGVGSGRGHENEAVLGGERAGCLRNLRLLVTECVCERELLSE